MPWFKVDDKLHDHRKSRKAGRSAMGVWVLAGSWSMDNETDGFVPADVLARWGTEGLLRWKDRRERRLVVAVGQADLAQGLTTARSRLNLANVLDDATARGIAPFVVGPPPTLDAEVNERLEIIVEAQADVCSRRSIPFVDCFYPLSEHDQWISELSASRDGRHPGQAGYGLLAWLVLHGGWETWLQIAP